MKIPLSPKHGLNPSIGVCFWCGEDDGSIALPGRLPGDREAPRRAVYSYEPCTDCRLKMRQGVTFMEASDTPNHKGQTAMERDVYPTGRFAVVKREAVHRIVQPAELAETVAKLGRCYMDRDAWKQAGFENTTAAEITTAGSDEETTPEGAKP